MAYILDEAQADGVLDPAERQAPHEAIPSVDQFAIENALRDLGKIAFVSNRNDVVDTSNGCAQVRDSGILITLAPLGSAKGAGTDRLEVGMSGFFACLGATWLTYVVERKDGQWTVTGTTGPFAIA